MGDAYEISVKNLAYSTITFQYCLKKRARQIFFFFQKKDPSDFDWKDLAQQTKCGFSSCSSKTRFITAFVTTSALISVTEEALVPYFQEAVPGASAARHPISGHPDAAHSVVMAGQHTNSF